jgi:hypothetical protein
MNRKQKVDKRYQSPVEIKWRIQEEYRLSPRRVLKPGVVVTIKGQRGGQFRYQYAQIHNETGAVSLAFVGGRNGHIMDRAFRPEQVGRILRQH